MLRRWAAAAVLVVLLGAGVAVAGADDTDYADSVDHALRALREDRGGDREAARQAADILESGTGQSQREILLDLRQDPPDVADAKDRLTALSRAVRSPVFAPEPAKARAAVRDILAQPRYASLRQGPSLQDWIRDALLRLVVWVTERIGGVVAGGFGLVLVAAAAAGLGLAVLVTARTVRWRGRREARARAACASAPAAARDRFAEADRLVAAGDLGGAVRALAGAVAAALSGERAWEVSPLTVRELFARAADPAALRPLLIAFEVAVYGDRPPDPAAYRRANASAAPFRPGRRAEA
jgi:hypothetical protein